VGHVFGRLIAFDLDGTIIDSSRDLAGAGNDLLGDGARVLVGRALAAAGRPGTPTAVARFLAIYDARLLDCTRPYDGLPDIVRAAREHARVAVLTNKPLDATEKVLTGLGLRDLFDDVIGGDGPFRASRIRRGCARSWTGPGSRRTAR
jgi:phosphoglycolate phosphatase